MTRIWHNGPPPHVGWRNASTAKDCLCWRWWDGKCWSAPAYPDYAIERVVECAKAATLPHRKLQWTDYWPENACVPRIKP